MLFDEGFEDSSKLASPKEVTIDANKHPEAARHVEDAQKAGKPDTLTVDRGGSKDRRREAMGGSKPVKGKDRDEYPPAVTKEGGKGASIRVPVFNSQPAAYKSRAPQTIG